MKKHLTILTCFLSLSVYAQQEKDTSLFKIQESMAVLEDRISNIEDQVLCYKNNDFETSIGGAARFNYILSSWDEDQINKGGEIKFDVFFINMAARYNDLSIHAEYRFYSQASGGPMLKNAYFKYRLKENHTFELGQMGVPFGNTINSNSFYLSLAYYIGLEADDDIGIKYTYDNKHLEIDAAFFKNSDLNFGSDHPTDPSRYSIDVSGQNQETNQFNGRFIWKIGDYSKNCKNRIGISGMYSGLYNIYTKEMGTRYSAAVHYQIDIDNWTLRAQWANYGFNPKNLPLEDLTGGQEVETTGTITVAAYGAPYKMADKGNLYTSSLKYNLPIKNRTVLSSINIYGEFNYLDKSDKQFYNSQMHILGLNLNLWKISIYAEYILGKNHPFLGNDWMNALGTGIPERKWNQRLNINIGLYF